MDPQVSLSFSGGACLKVLVTRWKKFELNQFDLTWYSSSSTSTSSLGSSATRHFLLLFNLLHFTRQQQFRCCLFFFFWNKFCWKIVYSFHMFNRLFFPLSRSRRLTRIKRTSAVGSLEYDAKCRNKRKQMLEKLLLLLRVEYSTTTSYFFGFWIVIPRVRLL